MQLNDPRVRNLAKVTAAGATIFAIGAAILVLTPQKEQVAEVADAEADIFAFSFAEKTQQQKFVDTLMQEGMEEPRAYDHNGNKLFFSTVTTHESPRQVLARFQRAFVENGVNKHVHLSGPPGPGANFPTKEELTAGPEAWKRTAPYFEGNLKYADDYVGGVVPYFVTDDAVVMSGVSTHDDAEDAMSWATEVAGQLKNARKGTYDLSQSTKAMRYVDAFREGNKTRVTAVWSDDDYAIRKLADIGDDINVSADVPMCPGCKRLMHFEGETEKAYQNTAIDGGRLSVDQALSFYAEALTSRGWRPSETALVLKAAEKTRLKQPTDSETVQFVKGGHFLSVTAWPNDDGTTGVHVSRSN